MRSLLFTAFLIALGSLTSIVHAKVAPPRPPASNPYPPTSDQDKARVQTAVTAVDLFLRKQPAPAWTATGAPSKPYVAKDLRCLQERACWFADQAFAANVQRIVTREGTISEIRFPHVMPWTIKRLQKGQQGRQEIAPTPAQAGRTRSAAVPLQAPQLQADEYMVHIYARFQGGRWVHLDVIMSEDAQGTPAVRYFFATPMRTSLPPGVRC